MILIGELDVTTFPSRQMQKIDHTDRAGPFTVHGAISWKNSHNCSLDMSEIVKTQAVYRKYDRVPLSVYVNVYLQLASK